ncbi:MAG TPA: S53 family peptidase [Castellaniella sp.]|uniref:S53 family peptidase n=1 Tax=Castellaniella sp. TaxID=1955812 RepID=UPI002F061201
MSHVELSGSARPLMAGARCIGSADPGERIEVTLVLRRPHADALSEQGRRMLAGEAFHALSRDAFARQFGAAPEDLDAVVQFARQYALKVVRQEAAAGTVVLTGPVKQFNQAFGIVLQHYQHPGGIYRGCETALRIPEALRDIVTAVLGLDDRPQARAHIRFRPPLQPARQGEAVGYLPTELAALYDFPNSAGAGQCVGLIELGGGYAAQDAQTYFSELRLAAPEVTVVSVDGAAADPTGDPSGPDGEVMLDVEIAGAVAPQAHLVLYFAANSDAGFIQAFNAALHDSTHRPSVISISWGGPEASWTAQSLQSFNQALQAAAMMGVTVCAAAGDSGAGDGLSGDHVDFPASSPYALACGGTRLEAAGQTITRETVWNDGSQGGAGGGGVSAVFARPQWQDGLTVRTPEGTAPLSRRGIPDVAGNADPATGYRIQVDGTAQVVGGTSAVAPLWAGLIARINALQPQPVGYAHARLYAAPQAFRDITQGSNGGFSATKGWDACTGLGSPKGQQVAQVFAGGTE